MSKDLRRLYAMAAVCFGCFIVSGHAQEQQKEKDVSNRYAIAAPVMPAEDRSGELGERLLRVLTRQAERDLCWLAEEQKGRQDPPHDYQFMFYGTSQTEEYPWIIMHQVEDCAMEFAVLSRFGPREGVAGVSRDELVKISLGFIRAVAQTHPVNGQTTGCRVAWDRFDALRHDYAVGLAAWLLWDKVDGPTQLLLARMLEHDADAWCTGPAPAQLFDDTQAESNAWSSSGMALAYCLLKNHPRRAIWGEKAKELMISAYATAADVASDRLVDGKPLNKWLRAPNAFPDHTVENHGIIHGDYLAAISEKVRTAVLYRLAGEPIPDAVLFNAGEVFDRLAFLGLPEGSHLYMQGSDYIARRLDSFIQACNIVPLVPSPLRSATFLRALDSIEHMERKRPEVPIGGWLGSPFDLGIHWAAVENYLIRRLFGSGSEPLPDDQVNAQLAGVHVSEPAKYAVHRTATTLSSFSWHTTAKASQVMGLTLSLDRDVLVSPVPVGSMIGEIDEAGAKPTPIRVRAHHVTAPTDGFGVTVELSRCGGGVLQHSAFVSLPDGTSVSLEQRAATRALTVASDSSGNVAIYDDRRGPYQDRARVYRSEQGPLIPTNGVLHRANWINVDDRLGYVSLGAQGFWLNLSDTYMKSPFGEQYREGLLAFKPVSVSPCVTGTVISSFALISCPNQASPATKALAAAVAGSGWQTHADRVLALVVGNRLVYANWSTEAHRLASGDKAVQVPPGECGWKAIQE